MRRVNSLNDLAERAAMLAPFEDTAAAAASAASSSPSSSASSSPVMYPSGLNPLASLATASSAVDPLRQQDGGHQRPLSQTGHTREVAMALTADKKRKREAAEHQHHPHRHVALRPSLPANSSPGRPIGRDLHPQPQHMLSTGNGHFVGHAASRAKMSSSNGAAGMSHHVAGSSIPRSTSLPSLAHMPSPAPLSPPPPLHSPAPPPPAFFAQISPNSIHLRDFMDNTKHLLTVMCTSARDNDATGKTGSGAAAALPGDLRLGFGAVVQPVEKASAYWFAEVPSAYEVLRATGLWQRGFLMEVLCQERYLVVDRTLYCGYKRVCQDKFTFYFDSDSETLRQLYAQHGQIAQVQAQAQAMAPAPASTFPFANAAGGSGIPFRFSPGMSLPAPVPSQPVSTAGPRAYTTSPSTPASTSTANGTGTGHHLATSCPASALNRLFTPIPRMASPSTVPLTPDGPRVVTVDRKHDSEHNHASGCCVKEEDDDDDADDDTDDGFYLLRPANTNDESTEEAESFEQPPAKLFLLPEYCYFDPTVLKKRSIRCIPCKMSLSKMGWKQHMLSTLHVEKKAKFNARGQTSQQSSELVYRSARGVLTCLACAVLLPPEDFDKHVVGAQHAKKRREWAMLDQIERWSDILSKKPRYSTATPLSPTLSSSVLTSPTLMPTTTTTVVTSGTATSGMDATASLGSSSSTVELHRSAPLPTTASETHQMELEGPELAELFYVECYPMTPVTGYTQWVALHSTRNWDARNFEVLITSRGKQDRLVVEPLSWKTTTTARGFLFNLAVKFERTYGPDPVQLCLVIRDTMGANPQGHEQEIQIPLGRAIVCSNSSQRLKRLQQLGEESLLTETEQRVIPHYTQCALVHKGREHRYRVKPLATVLAAAASATTSPTLATATTQAPSPSTPAGQPSSGAQQPQPQQQQRTQTPSAATPRPLPFVSGATASLLPSSSMNRSSLPTAALKALLSSSNGTPSHSAPLSTSMMTSLSSSSPAASPSTTTSAVPPVPSSPTMTTAGTGVPPTTTTTTPLGAAAASMQPTLHQRRPAAHPSMSSSPSSSSSSALASSSPAARQPLIVKTSS